MEAKTEPTTALATKADTVIDLMAMRLKVPAGKVFPILRDTAFKTRTNEQPFTDNEVAAALSIAVKYDLDPLAKDFYAIRNPKGGGLLLIMGVDGWIRQAHKRQTFKGFGEFEYEYDDKGAIVSCTGILYDEQWPDHPLYLTEYFSECVRNTENWQKSPHRMMRNRVICQLVRVGYGVGGVLEEDEAQSIRDVPAETIRSEPLPRKSLGAPGSAREIWNRTRKVPVTIDEPVESTPADAALSEDDEPASAEDAKAFGELVAQLGDAATAILEAIDCPTLATLTAAQARRGIELAEAALAAKA